LKKQSNATMGQVDELKGKNIKKKQQMEEEQMSEKDGNEE
jgi:hypothetical protein